MRFSESRMLSFVAVYVTEIVSIECENAERMQVTAQDGDRVETVAMSGNNEENAFRFCICELIKRFKVADR